MGFTCFGVTNISEDRHNSFLKIYQDKHIHDVYEKYGVQTGMYPKIMDNVKMKKW